MSVNSYIRPAAIPEALEALRAGQGRARLVAGATDLFLDMEHGKKAPEQLVDIRFIPELRQIQEEDGAVFIGAAALRLEDGVIAAAALAAGPVALTPLRLTDAEALLFGKAPSPELFHAAGAAARAQAHPRDSLLRGGGEFRRELLAALLEKLLASLCACAAPEKEV